MSKRLSSTKYRRARPGQRRREVGTAGHCLSPKSEGQVTIKRSSDKQYTMSEKVSRTRSGEVGGRRGKLRKEQKALRLVGRRG